MLKNLKKNRHFQQKHLFIFFYCLQIIVRLEKSFTKKYYQIKYSILKNLLTFIK
jgi:hypothetical protein